MLLVDMELELLLETCELLTADEEESAWDELLATDELDDAGSRPLASSEQAGTADRTAIMAMIDKA